MHKFFRSLLASLFSLCLTLVIFSTNVLAQQTLNWSFSSELQTLDPAHVVDATSAEILSNCYEGLYRLENGSKVGKGLAQKEELSADKLTYTFTLPKEARWSNNEPLTAKDFVYSWQRAVDPRTKASDIQLFEGVLNAKAIMAGQKSPKELGIKALNAHTLQVKLENQIPYFRSLLATPIFFPLNEKAVTRYGDKYGTSAKKTVFNGPFTVKDWTGSEQKFSFVKNSTYFDKKQVHLDRIKFFVLKSPTTAYNMYQAGQLDNAELDQAQTRELKHSKEFRARKEARIEYLDLNKAKAPLNNLNIRKAFSYAIDRKQLVKQVLDGNATPLISVIPQGMMTYRGQDFATLARSKEGLEFDPKKAKMYLQKGLKELGQKELKLELLGSDTDSSKKVSEYLQSQLEANLPQVKLTTHNITKRSMLTRIQQGDFELALNGWGSEYQDALGILEPFSTNSPYNVGKYHDPTYDHHLAQAKVTGGQKRIEHLVKASKLVVHDLALIPLSQPNTPSLLKERVKGLMYNSIEGYDFKTVQLK